MDYPGATAGPYQLTRKIGGGGTGIVYHAVRADGHYEKQVAIKMLQPGREADSDRHRLIWEGLTHAKLDHTNIAKCLNYELTDEGRIYLVLEYVDGVPIDQFCNGHALSIPDRIEMFLRVCDAVDAARGKGAMHLDLKPSNILVSSEHVPKLLGFGVAELLRGDEAKMRQYVQRYCTGEYASPELMRGESPTTACDLYSLGVILYELLTNRRPYELHGQEQEWHQWDNAPEIPKPSAVVGQAAGTLTPETISQMRQTKDAFDLRKTLRGDIDQILLKALQHYPEDRYRTVSELTDDLKNYLDGLPVRAHPDSARYRLAKFARRHPIGICLAVMLIFVLVLNLLLPNNHRQIAEKSRIAAQKYCEVMQSYTRKMNEEFEARSVNPQGADTTKKAARFRLPPPKCP